MFVVVLEIFGGPWLCWWLEAGVEGEEGEEKERKKEKKERKERKKSE